MPKRILAIQLGIILVCLLAVAQLALNFPFPAPLIKPLLPPKLRWPSTQVAGWVEAQNFDPNFLEFFARDPQRTVPPGPDLVSPADGTLTNITFQDGITYFVVGLSFWDVHVVRTPIAGVVKDIEAEGIHFDRTPTRRDVKEMVFLHGKAAPVQQIITLGTDRGDVKVRLITSYWASRIKVWVHPGQKLAKGERVGRMLLGSTVAVEFPGKLEGFLVHPTQHVVGGETVILPGEKTP